MKIFIQWFIIFSEYPWLKTVITEFDMRNILRCLLMEVFQNGSERTFSSRCWIIHNRKSRNGPGILLMKEFKKNSTQVFQIQRLSRRLPLLCYARLNCGLYIKADFFENYQFIWHSRIVSKCRWNGNDLIDLRIKLHKVESRNWFYNRIKSKKCTSEANKV